MNAPRTLLVTLLLAAPLALVGANAADTTPETDPLAGYPRGSYVMENGDIAIPLRADTPDYYTDEVHRKVMIAGDKGMAYDYLNDREVPLATNYLFIRPGAWMIFPNLCTMNFIYGNPGSFQIGSAGHCTAVGDQVVLLLYPGVLANVGTTTASRDFGVGDDWSLTPIRSNMQGNVDANVAVIGGPQGGAYNGGAYVGLASKHFGHGLVVGTGGTPRAGHILRASGDTWTCACVAAPGDSGSPMLVITPDAPLGKGLGVLTHLVVGTGGPIAGTMLREIPVPIRNGDVNPLPPA